MKYEGFNNQTFEKDSIYKAAKQDGFKIVNSYKTIKYSSKISYNNNLDDYKFCKLKLYCTFAPNLRKVI